MELHPEVALDETVARAIARGLWAVATVDGLHAREAALIASFWAETGGGHAALAQLTREPIITAGELAAALDDVEMRRLFLKTALLLAWADGKVSKEEEKILATFASALGLADETTAALEAQVKEYLLGHLTHVHNSPAVAEVAAKLGV
jgi:uncharacterized membrane protein YebE (DUF533 family)